MSVDTRTVTSVALAVACVVAVAAAADGFDSLSTDPEDLVDPEFDRLPVGEGEMESLRDEVVAREGSGDRRPEPSDSGERSPSASTASGAESEVTTRSESRAESRAQDESRAESAGSQERTTRSAGASDGSGSPPPDDSDWPLLAALLAALGVAAALYYRYADRFGSDAADEGGPAFGDASPESEVERAWLRLVRRVDADRPESRTPGEWAASATDAGLDAASVATLTRAFEAVRYGDGDETEERRRRVRRALDRLDARYGADGGEPEDDPGDRREGGR